MRETVEQWFWSSPIPTFETTQLWVVVGSLVLAWGLSVAWSKRVPMLAFVPPAVLGLLAITRALQSAWLADDAYITFRYSANWARGLGPVRNAGDRVEGYTNPLWMAVLALGEFLGVPAPWFAPALNLIVLFSFIACLWWGLRKAFPNSDVVPVLPGVLALSPAVREFGTSGLETLPASTAVTFAALSLLLGMRPRAAGALVCIAAMLRPDHALFFAPLGFAVVSTGTLRERFRAASELVIPAIVFAAFWILRWRWYGDFYPNTYYAKSASIPYWVQGSIYVAEFVSATRVWWPVVFAPLAALALWFGSRSSKSLTPVTATVPSRSPFFVFSIFGGLVWLLYVARVGGDFMEFRFALTSLPLLGLAGEVLVWSQWRAPFAARLAAAFVVLLPLAQDRGFVLPMQKLEHIALESSFYPVKTWNPLVVDSGMFRHAIGLAAAKPPNEMLALGCVGMVGYYNLDLPIFDTYGKASREVAHRPVVKRGRPGHEKTATREDLRKAGVVWSVDPVWSAFNNDTRVSYKDGQAWLVRLEPSMLEWARSQGRNVDPKRMLNQVIDATTAAERLDELEILFERDSALLDAHLASLGIISPRAFTCDELRTHCESSIDCKDEVLELNGDASCRLGASRSSRCDGKTKFAVTCDSTVRAHWLVSRTPVDVATRLASARPRGARAIANAVRAVLEPSLLVDFEGPLPASVKVSGDAMTVTNGGVSGQLEVRGHRGASLLNTYAKGDGARGELTLSAQLDGSSEHVVSLLIGGGRDCSREFVELTVDGTSFGKACGAQDEVLRQHAWLVPPNAREVTLKVVDASPDGWGHVLIDDIGVWRLP